MNNFELAIYQLFDPIKHGGDSGDTPIGQVMYIAPIECVEDLTIALICGLHVGEVIKYHWVSPISHLLYTLCVPKGIVIFQRMYHRRYCYKLMRHYHKFQLYGKWKRKRWSTL